MSQFYSHGLDGEIAVWMERLNVTERGAKVFKRLLERPYHIECRMLGLMVERLKAKHQYMPTAMVRRNTTEDGRLITSNFTKLKGREGKGL